MRLHPEDIIIEKDTHTPIFTAALLTTARTWKQPGCPSTDEWMKKTRYSNTGIPQETRKKSNKSHNSTPKATRKGRKEEAQG